MKKAEKVYVRLCLGDLILTKEENENITISLVDQDGNCLDLNSSFIGFEDEEGNECEEDGTYYNNPIKQ